jgi:uncharacterized protein (DUF1015 family)
LEFVLVISMRGVCEMAIVKPFKALRPTNYLAGEVASLPYDVMNSEEARVMVQGKPYSFLHVDKAEIDLDPEIDLYDNLVYQKARKNLDRLVEDKILQEDAKECLYIYRLTMNGRSQTGLVCCTSIDDYRNDVIKKHEQTREEKEIDRINHVESCDANTGPIFLMYRDQPGIRKVLEDWTKNRRSHSAFTAEDGVIHEVWVIDQEDVMQGLRNSFRQVDYLYIADGHHRAASAVKVGMKRREKDTNYAGTEEYNYFLSVIFADEELYLMDYNRVVKDLNGFTVETFLKEVEKNFYVTKYDDQGGVRPRERHHFGMLLEGCWYDLKAKEGTFDENDSIGKLDVTILQKNLLTPILGISNPRTDKRIDFIGGIRGIGELERRGSQDMKVAFSMFPTSIKDLMDIADKGEVMPPKSTWFEPKLRSGLFIHKLK